MDAISELLRRHWGIETDRIRPLDGGMNSETWLVDRLGGAYVAKHVNPSRVGDLVHGCEAAAALADAGLRTGRPIAATDGRLVVAEHGLALLEFVPGRELRGDSRDDQHRIAATLAAVHSASEPERGSSTASFAPWMSTTAPGVSTRGWLARAVEAVRDESNDLPLTWSQLHADPSPDAFRYDESAGVTGLIDWTGATRGPILYDVASAVMYLGGPASASSFLASYRTHGPLDVDELGLLDVFHRFRWVVQAAYFAERIDRHDLTGISDQAANEKGLADARNGLAEFGIVTT